MRAKWVSVDIIWLLPHIILLLLLCFVSYCVLWLVVICSEIMDIITIISATLPCHLPSYRDDDSNDNKQHYL